MEQRHAERSAQHSARELAVFEVRDDWEAFMAAGAEHVIDVTNADKRWQHTRFGCHDLCRCCNSLGRHVRDILFEIRQSFEPNVDII